MIKKCFINEPAYVIGGKKRKTEVLKYRQDEGIVLRMESQLSSV